MAGVSAGAAAPDFPAFVAAWNEALGQALPPPQRRMVEWLAGRRDSGDARLLLMAFRGAGKSTLVGLYAAWLLRCRPALRILAVAADQELARKMVRNVKRIVERHPDCAGMKPKARDQWASGQFTVVREAEWRDPSMLARGIDGNVTGSRADVVICDDVEVPKTSGTRAARAELREKLRELDYVLVPGGMHLYLGTPHSHFSIYAAMPRGDDKVPFLDGFARLEIPLLAADGTCAWPERYTPERIEKLRRRSGTTKFASQALLLPADPEETRLDPALLRPYDHDLVYREAAGEAVLSIGGKRMVAARCCWDPAYGRPKSGDASVVAIVFQDGAGHFYLHALRHLEFDPGRLAREPEADQQCRAVAAFARDCMAPAVAVEGNGIGKLLPGLLRQALDALHLFDVSVIEENRTTNKELRILGAIEPALEAGRLHAHRSVIDSAFAEEMQGWRPQPGRKRQKDDALDAVAACLAGQPLRWKRNPPARPPAAEGGPPPRSAGRSWSQGAAPAAASFDFDV